MLQSSRSWFAVIAILAPLASTTASTTFYVSDYIDTDAIYKISSTGAVSPFAQDLPEPTYMAMDSAGNLYVSCDSDGTIREISPSGQVSLFASGFSDPGGLAFDSSGNLFVANTNGDSIVKITPSKTVTTVASNLFAQDLVIDASNNLYVSSVIGYDLSDIYKIAPGGQPGIYAADVPFNGGMAMDPSGNLFCANYSGVDIVEVPTTGNFSTFATGSPLSGPTDVAFDNLGNLYATDYPTSLQSDAIDEMSPTGHISTFLGEQAAGFFPGDILAVVPEPASLSVFAASMALLAGARPRRPAPMNGRRQ